MDFWFLLDNVQLLSYIFDFIKDYYSTMANLFSHKLLQENIKNLVIPDMESKIEVLQLWANAIANGNIKKKTESECEQTFNLDIFHKVLWYTFFPTEQYTLEAKWGNEISGQKADATLGYFNSSEMEKNVSLVQVAVEIKDANTLLDKSQRREGNLSPIQQWFKYKPQYNNCKRVIVTNFIEIRLYKDTQLDYEIRQLTDLVKSDNDYQNFKIFWYLLNANHLIAPTGRESVTEKLLSAIRIQSEQITKKFYQEYKTLRLSLINDIRNNNPEVNLENVIQKSQKVIDRVVFIHFCEDFGLLPEGKLAEVINYSQSLVGVSVWQILSGFFEAVNSGSDKLGIPKWYNGWLFHEDKELNILKIWDDICRKFVDLWKYDFQEELSINILGHIFEQSISDLENLRIDMLGTEIETEELWESTKSNKRKKDGIFYTPEYIVDYIVRNSLGKYLEEQFEVIEKKYLKNEKKMSDKVYQETQQKIYSEYKVVLANIKVLDPACGSGAFLVKVFDYLLGEHKRIGSILGWLFDNESTYKSILQNNIFGVDLNAESVEITKLSLWLKTAEKGKKLADLDNNIKCGNSLIDDHAVAGDKAFDWNKEFATIMKGWGFDVVVGNPPYVNANDIKKSNSAQAYNFLKNNYETAKWTVDLYIYFFERWLKLLKENGILSYITPNRFLSASYGASLREYILNNYQIISFVDYSDKKVFSDASTYPVISFIKNNHTKKYILSSGEFNENTKEPILNDFNSDMLTILEENIWWFLLNDKITITKKVFDDWTSLKNVGKINATSTAKEAEEYSGLVNNNKPWMKLINTWTIDPYISLRGKNYLIDKWRKILNPTIDITSDIISQNRRHLYSTKKIIISKIWLKCEAFLDKDWEYASINTNCIHGFSDEFLPGYVLCWLSSKLYNYTFECLFDWLRMSWWYLLYSAPNLKNTSIKNISLSDQQPFIEKADAMIELKKEFHEKIDFNLRFLQSKFSIEKPSTKLSKFREIDFSWFLKELKVKKLPMDTEAELMRYFEKEKTEILVLKNKIDETDKEIDDMVFDLYELTEEERKVVLGII